MGFSRYDAALQGKAAWNAGKTVGTTRPLTHKQIWAIRLFLDREGRLRDQALFDLAIDSKLRGCDLVKIKTVRGLNWLLLGRLKTARFRELDLGKQAFRRTRGSVGSR